MTNDLAQRLRRFTPIRDVLTMKDDTILGEHNIDGIAWAEENCKPGFIVVDPLSPNSPNEVDWTSWLAAVDNPKTDKFHKRNGPALLRDLINAVAA